MYGHCLLYNRMWSKFRPDLLSRKEMSNALSCCPDAEFQLLDNGLQVRDLHTQDDSQTLQFFPYRAIQSVRYYYSRDDREGMISIWIHAHGTPGAGGLSFRWRFPCNDSGMTAYQTLIARIP